MILENESIEQIPKFDKNILDAFLRFYPGKQCGPVSTDIGWETAGPRTVEHPHLTFRFEKESD